MISCGSMYLHDMLAGPAQRAAAGLSPAVSLERPSPSLDGKTTNSPPTGGLNRFLVDGRFTMGATTGGNSMVWGTGQVLPKRR